jgi:hypothetical protein
MRGGLSNNTSLWGLTSQNSLIPQVGEAAVSHKFSIQSTRTFGRPIDPDQGSGTPVTHKISQGG